MKQLISGILEYTDVILVFILTFVFASLLQYKLKRLKLTPGTQTHRLVYALSHFAFPLFVLVVSLFFFYYRECSANPIYSAWLILWGTLTLLSIADFLVVQISIALVGKCQIPKVLRNLVQGVIFVIILCLVVKFIFGKDISILMTSSAILTGIIGFAMQGIFSNLLAGAVIHSSGRFNIGDWVLVGGHDGHITQINWSDTWITTLSGNLVSVPNASVLSSTIVNNSAPTRSGRLNIPFSASYDNPPHEVKQCLIEAAMECPFTSTQHQHPAPCVLLTSYSDFAVNYELRVWITDYNNYHPAIGAINEAVWYKFKRKGIEIPFPMSGKLMENVLLAAARINQVAPADSIDAENILVDLFNSDFVKKLIPATALSQDQLPALFKTVAHEFHRVTFTAGEYIFRQGEKDDEALYIFVAGKLAGEMRLPDGKVVPFEPESGSLLGEMSFLTGAPRAASIKVLETASLLKVAPSTMRKLVHEVPPLMDALSQLAVDRTQQIESSLSKTLSQEKTDQIRKSMFRRFWNVLMRDDEK
jgi:small-conductance mechanosensitive channel/CRP-like cAMP-binding protein